MADESSQPIEREATPGDDAQNQTQAQASKSANQQDEQDERYEGATPPGYDWPTHGGYLGCLLGMMIACVLAPLGIILFGFVGAFLIHPLGGFGFALAILVTAAAYLAVFVALTRLGWRLGKRFLREYEQPSRPVWGEDDEEDYPPTIEPDSIVEADPIVEDSQPTETQSTPSQSENAG